MSAAVRHQWSNEGVRPESLRSWKKDRVQSRANKSVLPTGESFFERI